MSICKINLNQELNGIEITFEAKPAADILAALKGHGFRWSPKNKLWYAKNTAERFSFASSLGDVSTTAAPVKALEIINLDNLGVIPENFSRHGSELAKFIREDLKKRGVKGCTIRTRSVTYDTGITVTIKANADDFASLEEAAERYTQGHFSCDLQTRNGLYISKLGHDLDYSDYEAMTDEEKEAAYYTYLAEQIKKVHSFSNYHQERENNWELSTDFYNKCLAVFQIANQWNYDHSDSMTDYFDVGYYLDIDIKHEEFEPRATMTDKERNQLEDERAKEKADFEAWQKQYEEEQRKAKEEAEKYNNWVHESEELIYNDISIIDYDEAEQVYISGLVGGCGKESTLDELKEEAAKNPHINAAVISRVVVFHDLEALNRFYKMFLNDFAFLSGMGGSATEDIRIESGDDFYKLTQAQRETVEMYLSNCVAIMHNDKLVLVVDPQGYNYARYTYITDNCTIEAAPAKLEAMRKESEQKPAFYIPAPIAEQVQNIKEGDTITIYQCDGWILNKVLDGFGTVSKVYQGTWAQYSGYYITLVNGKKQKTCFIRNNHDCLIYPGIAPQLPEDVTERRLNDHMSELFNYDVLLPNIYKYYLDKGVKPLLDTCYR